MKSAREIVEYINDPNANLATKEWLTEMTEAIQQAREDGARWGIQRVVGCLKSTAVMNDENFPKAEDVRKVAP